MNTQVSPQDLQKKISGYLDDLARETDRARKSETMQKYLEFVARFHQYSFSNICLILLAKPDATHVAGYQTWLKLGRYVKKGEKGIPIFAPLIGREYSDDEDSPRVLRGFRIVHVFDISQTDGQSLPPVPDWKSPQKDAELTEKLIHFAENKGISVTFKDLPGETQGVSKGGAIEVSPNAGTKTLIHEITHELMHRGEDSRTHLEREMEAEATAYSVCKFNGFKDLACPNYLALNQVDEKSLLASLGRIQATVGEIIKAIINDN